MKKEEQTEKQTPYTKVLELQREFIMKFVDAPKKPETALNEHIDTDKGECSG